MSYTPYLSSLPKPGDKNYIVKDLYLAAALLTIKLPVVEMNIQHESKKDYFTGAMKPMAIGYFTFENSPSLTEAVNMYLNREMRLEPIEYFTNVRHLKSQVMTAERNPFAPLEK